MSEVRARRIRPTKAKYMKSAARCYAIRKALDMTQRDLAYYLRVAVGTVSNWETGRTKPSGLADQMIRRIAVEHGLDTNRMEFRL